MKKFFAIVAIVAFAACNSAESTTDGKDTIKADTIPATPLQPAKDTTKKDSMPPVAKKDTMPSKDTSKAAKKK